MKTRLKTRKQCNQGKTKGVNSLSTQNSINQNTQIRNEKLQIQSDQDDDQYKIQDQPRYSSCKREKNYRNFDQKGIRKVKTIACQCLKSMDLKQLYHHWSKKQQGERNKRYIILLIIMILDHEKPALAKQFVSKYKKMCSDTLEGKNVKLRNDYSSNYHRSMKHHLQLSMKAAQRFIDSGLDVDSGLKIMQNQTQPRYYLAAKKRLIEYRDFIKSNKHKI